MAGSAHLYSLVLLSLLCIILDGAELFGGEHFLDIPFLLCALVFISYACFFLSCVWFWELPWRLIFPFSEFLGLGARWQWMDGWVCMHPGMENVWMAELLYVIRA
jgi:hypothetical protein